MILTFKLNIKLKYFDLIFNIFFNILIFILFYIFHGEMKNMANYLSAMLFEYIKKTRFIKKNFLNY